MIYIINILDYIPKGQANAITRTELSILTGICDRSIREMIATERRNTVILNTQDGKGYFVPLDTEKVLIRQYVDQETHRAKSIFYNLRAAREQIKGVEK